MIFFAALVWYAVFQLPFHFPPKERLWSASYAFGFNNSVAILALFVLLMIACFYFARRSHWSVAIFDGMPNRRPLWLTFAILIVLYGCATAAMYRYQVTSAPWLMWEVRHLNYRTLLMDIYHLHPYTDFSAEYGPVLTYSPLCLYRLFKPFGGTHEQAYFAAHFLLNVAGLWCMFYLLWHAHISNFSRVIIFVSLATSGFAPYMGINGVLLRYLLPYASLLIAWRNIGSTHPINSFGWRWVVICLLSVANLLLSSEIGLAFIIAWMSYCVFVFRRDARLLMISVLAILIIVLLSWRFLPAAYYLTLFQFSKGANNLPLMPAPHLLFYLITLFLAVPALLGGAWNKRVSDLHVAALSGACGVLCLVMVPGALGRCDPPHVLFYGMGATLLLMILLAQHWPRALPLYAAIYFAIFVIWMQLVNLRVFYNVKPQAFLSRRGIADVGRKFLHSSNVEQTPALSVLSQYPRIGLPFVTFGDPTIEEYIIRRGQLQPDYYVSVVALYTPAAVQRKLQELAQMEYILVPSGFGVHALHDPCRELLVNLQEWFLFPFSRPCHVQPLDPTGEIDSFVSNHFVAVQNIGSSVLMRRVSP